MQTLNQLARHIPSINTQEANNSHWFLFMITTSKYQIIPEQFPRSQAF